MKLSEAIRLGAMLRPQQAFRTLFDPETGASCALGAAAEAMGLLDTTQWNAFVGTGKGPPEWKWIAERPYRRCPVGCARRDDVQELVIHLNNVHRWTRERIADWVATVEPAESLETPLDSASPAVAFPAGESATSCPREKNFALSSS